MQPTPILSLMTNDDQNLTLAH